MGPRNGNHDGRHHGNRRIHHSGEDGKCSGNSRLGLGAALKPGKEHCILVAAFRGHDFHRDMIAARRSMRPMRMVAKALTLMRLPGVIGIAVEMKMNEWRVTERRKYGEAQVQYERAFHEGLL